MPFGAILMTQRNLNDVTCRICRTNSNFFYKDKRTFYVCPDCTLIFTNESVTGELEEQHYKSQWGTEDEKWWKGQAQELMSIITSYKTPKRILDFGAGRGDLTRQLRSGYGFTI